ASIRSESNSILDVKEASGRDALDRFFAIENNTLRAAAPLIPSMLSTNVDLIRQDCLCYLMERYPL
ncbi:MAG: peptidase M14, partial [Gammaproteobacteria bacterium]